MTIKQNGDYTHISDLPTPTIITGLWGNPNHHRYKILADMFKLFDIEGQVVGKGDKIQNWHDFSHNIEVSLENNCDQKVLVGYSIGGSFLLRHLHRNSIKFDKLFLIGFDPTPIQRMASFPDSQKKIWETLGISKNTIIDMVSSDKIAEYGNGIFEAFSALKSDRRVIFIHGDKDETISYKEISDYSPVNLYRVRGLGHNSSNEIDKVLAIIQSNLFESSIHKVFNKNDLLSLNEENYTGLIPYFSDNRVGWFVTTDIPFISKLPDYQNKFIYIGKNKSKPEKYLKTANFGENIFAVNIEFIIENGYEFYKPLIPPRSQYKDSAWIHTAYSIDTQTSNNSIISGSYKNKLIEINKYKIRAYEKLSAHSEILDLMDDENNLFDHLFEVYKTLLLFKIDEYSAFEYSLFHDIGKGIKIKSKQLTAAREYIKDTKNYNIRELGEYRLLVNDTGKLNLKIKQDENNIVMLLKKYSITEDDMDHDRKISSKILKHINNIKKRKIIENYLTEKSEDTDIKLIRVADLISPYMDCDYNPNYDEILKALSLRLDAIKSMYGSCKEISYYLDDNVVLYLKNIY